jgi:hypothetical protein
MIDEVEAKPEPIVSKVPHGKTNVKMQLRLAPAEKPEQPERPEPETIAPPSKLLVGKSAGTDLQTRQEI